LLSVPHSYLLSEEKIISMRTIKSMAITESSPNGSFFEKIKPFGEQLMPNIQITDYEDPAVFNQMIRTTKSITISIRVACFYRDDWSGRVLIPLSAPELSIDYFICCLTKNKKYITPFLTWVEQ
jgi:hypothetical protein